MTRAGRDPTQGHPSGGRWDPGVFDTLYTSLTREGALTEVYFHLSQQPIFPSKPSYIVNELKANADSVLTIADASELPSLGAAVEIFQTRDYKRTQDIGDAAFFLGFDGMIVPSARGRFQNLVLFTERLAPGQVASVAQEPIDWRSWRATKH